MKERNQNKNKTKPGRNQIDHAFYCTKKESYGTKNSLKYIIGYNDDDVIRPFCIKLSQMIGYVKHFDSNKAISFKAGDNKLLKKV